MLNNIDSSSQDDQIRGENISSSKEVSVYNS